MTPITSSFSETISLAVSSLLVLGIVTVVTLGRKLLMLPKEMVIVKAALFRLLRSNRLQGIAISKIAEVQKEGTANGKTDEAVKAVAEDQVRIDTFLIKAALGKTDVLDDVIKEEET